MDDNLESLWENLREVVVDQLSPANSGNGNGWLDSEDYPENGDSLDDGSEADEENHPSGEGE